MFSKIQCHIWRLCFSHHQKAAEKYYKTYVNVINNLLFLKINLKNVHKFIRIFFIKKQN